MRKLVTVLITSVALILVSAGASGCELVQNKPPPQEIDTVKQELLHTIPLEAAGPQHIVTSVITLSSGASTGRHVHHGLECGYVLDGEIELFNDGQPPRHFSAGDTFVTYRDLPHNVTNPGTEDAAVLVAFVVDADKRTTLSFG